VLVLVAGVVLGLATLVVGTVNHFVAVWPTTYQPRAAELTDGWNQWVDQQTEKYPRLDRLHFRDGSQLWSQVAPEDLMSHFTTAIRALGGSLSNVFLILLTTLFLLGEATLLPDKLREIAAGSERSVGDYQRIKSEINRYMGIKTFTSLLTGLVVTVGLVILRVDFALLWGVLAFLLNFVPNIGSIIAAVPAVLLTLLQHGFGTACIVVILYLAVNTVVGNLLEPRWMGRGLDLSTLVVFVSLVFWGWVLGPVGMVLSVPLTMTVKIALEGHSDTRWLGILLGGGISRNTAREK
jgi:predicted PurR-regulated permease PerM